MSDQKKDRKKDQKEAQESQTFFEKHKLLPEHGNDRVKWTPLASFFVAFGAVLAAETIILILLSIAAEQNNSELNYLLDNLSIVQSVLVQLFTALLVSYIIVSYVGKRGGMKALGFIKIKKRDFIMALQGFGIYLLTVIIANMAIEELFRSFESNQPQELVFDVATGTQQLALTFVALAIVTPIYEEIVFRGFAFQGVAKSLGFLPAAIAVNALFGLAHQQVNVAVDTFVLGMVASWFVWKTRSIWPAILLHSIKNMVAFTARFIL